MSLSPIRQRYLNVYPLKFTKTIRPPLWFWLGIDNLANMSDAGLKARAMADHERNKEYLERVRREIIEDIYIKAYPYKEDNGGSTPWCALRIKNLPLDMSEAEVIAMALSDYEHDKIEIKKLNAFYQKMQEDNEEEEE